MAAEHMDRKKRRCSVKNTLDYKGYIGSVEFSEEGSLFFGKVLGIRALISYEGENTRSLVENFHSAVYDYLALCEERGTEPEKPLQMQ